jgi:hypothetical protein
MNTRARILVWAAVATAAVAGLASTAAARTQPQLRGTSDFPAASGSQAGAPLLRGLGDFATARRVAPTPVPSAPTIVAVGSTGFAWTDAGIGAAAALGLVLLAGGVVAGLLLARGSRRPLHGANL